MAIFDLTTPQGRFDFSTNLTLRSAFQQAAIEVCGESITNSGDGTSFPYLGKAAYNKISPYLTDVFKSGIAVNNQQMAAFISTLPKSSVDEDDIFTTLFDTLKTKVKVWIEHRQGVSDADKI
jgi:hypothetical protein